MNRSIRNLILNWGCVLLVLGWGAKEAQRIPAAAPVVSRISALDTVTYGDKRIVYTVDVDTATNTAGQLRYVLDLATAPEGARMRVLMKADFDSAMIITGDTFAMSPTDSTTAVARAIAWSVTDPFTITLAWHVLVPPPVTNMTLAMVFDTLKANWTESADDYIVTGGLNSGPGPEDYTDTVGAPPNLQQVVAFGSYWSCVEALRATVIGDSRCLNTVYADTGATNDSFPNEPAGYLLITDRAYTDYEEDGWTISFERGNNYTIPFTDGGALISPSDVAELRYGAGQINGSPVTTAKSFTGKASLYISLTFKFSADWQGHRSGVNKMYFIVADDYGGGGDPAILAVQGVGAGALQFQVRMQGPGDEGSTASGANISSNLASGTITRDVWYTAEIIFVANTASNHDGEVHVWLNDVKTHEYTDVLHFDESADASAHKFMKVRHDPIWGGQTDTVDVDMYQYVDHLRISGE